MDEASKDVKVPGNRWLWQFMLALMAQEILARVHDVWLTKPVSRSLAFFISYTAVTWFFYHDDPQKTLETLLHSALGAVLVFCLYRW